MEIDIKQLEANIEKLAKDAGVSDSELKKVIAASEIEIKERGTPEELIRQNSLALVQMKLKRKLSGSVNLTDCRSFYLAKGKAFDESKKPREQAEAYIEDFSLEDAIEAGYANADGKLLYNDFDWRKGKEIPEEDWQATGVLVIDYNGDIKLADARLRGNAAISNPPLFKPGTVSVYMKQKGENKYDITISNEMKDVEDEYVEPEEFVEYVTKAYPERVLSSLIEIEDYLVTEDAKAFGSWCIVEGNVMSINSTKNGSTAISIEDISLPIEGDNSSFTVFFNEGVDVDMRDRVVGATFIVSPYRNRDGQITLNGLGYWVPNGDRAYKSSLTDEPDAQDPW